MEIQEKLTFLKNHLNKIKLKNHMIQIINFDAETACPVKGLEDQFELINILSDELFKLNQDKEYIQTINYLHDNKEKLNELDSILIDHLYKEQQKTINYTPEFNLELSKTFNTAFINWSKAKQAKDFNLFKDDLQKILNLQYKMYELSSTKFDNIYDFLLDSYEPGMTSKDLDVFFEKCKQRIIPLLEKIKNSKVKIRTDFLSRKVPVSLQQEFSKYLIDCIGFDLTRGSFTTSEHPFTDELYKNDVRITTHYYEDNFLSNLFSIVHEGGHAIFAQNQLEEDHNNYLNNSMSLGMHESVSRFYENRIARSKEFIDSIIYPSLSKYFPSYFDDVSKEELYQGINLVVPSLIRTEADELTYTLHIIIRYELEKDLLNGKISVDTIKDEWNKKYQKYLGITPENDAEGILQDVHWASGFGYFPTYSLGNAYNSMYYKRLEKEIDISKAISTNNILLINNWMKDNVFSLANRNTSKVWIKKITNKDFSGDDFLSYLEEKYSKIYKL